MAEDFFYVTGANGPMRLSREQFAESLWPYRTQAPAWYAARMAHNIGLLSPERWADMPELYHWLQELQAILLDPQRVEMYRQSLLTPEEREAVRAEQAEISAHGW
jgi:hypothetical protein